jgi:glycosyltransferase involved in cell wall biosynthesis
MATSKGRFTNKRILVLCPFPEGIAPAQRLKYEQYFDDWKQSGYDVDVSPFMSMGLFDIVWKNGYFLEKVIGAVSGYLRRLGDLLRLHRYDIIYVFMWVTPLGTTLSERIARLLSGKIVYDLDDNTHIGQDLPQIYNPNPILRFLKNPAKPLYLLRTADYVITSSPFLNDEAQRYSLSKMTTYITSSVDTNHFVPRKTRPSSPKVVIGWTGTFSSRPFLDSLAPALRKLGETHLFEFRIIGNFDYEMEGVDLRVIHFDKATEIEDLSWFDIGVYPLPDDRWVLGKSGLKAIVYMAMGLPVVASPVGTTPSLYARGEIGYMAGTDDEWVAALARLIDDEALRQRMGETARRVAEEFYSKTVVRRQYLDVLDSVGRKTA